MKKDRYEELTEIWLRKAQDDFLWAQDSFKTHHFGAACFICQQIAEKALKAFLFLKKEKLVRTHNLIGLLKKCKRHDSAFEELINACKILNDYYTDTRYPDIWDYDRFNDEKLASQALSLAEEILKFVEKKIKAS